MEIIYGMAVEVLKRVATVANDEISLAWGMKDDLKRLEETMSTLNAVLSYAEKKQEDDVQLHVWLGRLKDVFFDVWDVLDEFECELLRREVLKTHGSIGRKVRRFFSLSNPLAFRFSIAHQIKVIRQKLDDAAKDKSNFHLEHHHDEGQERREMTSSFIRPSEIIGRESDKDKIINVLLQKVNTDVISVTPIVGIGGQGKTTLAKLVYNDDKVTEKFDLKLWVCVQQDFNVTELTRKILISSISATNTVHQSLKQTRDISNLSIDQLQLFLQSILKDKKVLLVLDDVWNEDRGKWNEVRDLLSAVCTMGSRVIVTTRNTQVASIMGTTPTHHLECLSRVDSLSLFFKYAFVDEQEAARFPKLKDIGKQIVQKCGGLPLALKTLGSLLCSKTDEGEWTDVRDSEIWELKRERSDPIFSALKLSYSTMSPSLKQCFAYCSLIPKNNRTDDLDMTRIWMALGIIHSRSDKMELESIGKLHFKELCGRSFFQYLDDAEQYYNLIQEFEMHDLVHDLATSIIRHEFAKIDSNSKTAPNERVRHLRILLKDGHDQSIVTIVQKLQRVRSIFVAKEMGEEPNIEESFLSTCVSRFKYLRLLHLDGLCFDVLPSSIGALKHLRYLDLSGNKKIKKLPNSICKLQSLQTLYLHRCSELEELPRDIRNLVSLRSLSITTKETCLSENGIGCLRSLRFLWITECRNLRSLPQDMRCCTTLRTLIVDECEQLELASGPDEVINNQLSLRTLMIHKLPQTTALPQWLQGAADTLQLVVVQDCCKLATLPKWLPNLTTLETLAMLDCPNLSSLPEGMERLTSLTRLRIKGCDALEERCKRDIGEDWP
ncbi:disease resistance protein RGA2 [Morus notabilis]|uniref:disease resistance protein RGA2 n=1 Tax=Morus notabilis TaxID=981085 RepID=UPI000CED5CDD|nr:disease resistance protein RGA2 [Morus notabilis]XP_024024459.1 disease resistance protein RGA2 [Morus notabilis]